MGLLSYSTNIFSFVKGPVWTSTVVVTNETIGAFSLNNNHEKDQGPPSSILSLDASQMPQGVTTTMFGLFFHSCL